MKRRLVLSLLSLLSGYSYAWIDYGTRVEPVPIEYGKEFIGISLKLDIKNIEIEQDTPEPVKVTLRNATSRTKLLLDQMPTEGRLYLLYLVFATGEGGSFFSRNLLVAPDCPVTAGTLKPKSETVIFGTKLDQVEVGSVTKFVNGIPFFASEKSVAPTGELVPQVYSVKAILISAIADKRPDFVAASNAINVLLKPKRGERMPEDEKREKLAAYMKKLKEGAYGGKAVSSQLAALGEDGIDPLIEIAENAGGGKAMESRIWAIVTLCNIKLPRATEYIHKRLSSPTSLGDLNFLAWHCQACRTPEIEKTLHTLLKAVVANDRLPWQDKFPEIPEEVKSGFVEFTVKHFSSNRIAVSDEVAELAVTNCDDKGATFALEAWKPRDPDAAIKVVLPIFTQRNRHPNLKSAALKKLKAAFDDVPFREIKGPGDVDVLWQDAGFWMERKGYLRGPQMRDFLIAQVFSVRETQVQLRVMRDLQRVAGNDYPVKTRTPTVPDDWITTWRWALKAANVEAEEAIPFLCRQMRTKEELPDGLKRALLIELKRYVGDEFPLKSTDAIDLDDAWPTCGQWLVRNGYFKQR